MAASNPSSNGSLADPNLPEDRDSLLERAGPQRTAIFEVVRKVLDDLETVAPWRLLYSPPDGDRELLEMGASFLEIVGGVPQRVEELLQSLSGETSPLGEQTLEDIDFFFSGIHGMVTADLKRLENKLEQLRSGEAAEAKADVCEITADVKGKYSSAVMGAAASIIAEGLWNGVEIEPILFPEKAEEFRRNERLVSDIDELIATIERLPEEMSFAELIERWGRHERLDRYVLADLDRLKSQLGMLLRAAGRRALYTGDYHQVQHRETLLSERLNQLETLHRLTWSEPAGELDEETFARLGQLVLEVAAVIDVNILQGLIGDKRLKDLRAVVVTEKAQGGPSEMGASLPESLRSLLPLVAEDDLATFFGALQGAVLKRLSLRLEEKEGPQVAEVSAAAIELEAPSELLVADSEPTGFVVEGLEEEPAPASSQERRSEELAVLRAAQTAIQELTAKTNPSRKGFLMTERLLGKHGRIPPRMFGLALPFVEEVRGKLVPKLESVVRFTDFPAETVESMKRCSHYLCNVEVGPANLSQEIPRVLAALSRLLGETESKLTELVVNRSVF